MVTRVTMRALMGFPLCRDEDLLNTSILFTSDVLMTAVGLGAMPWFMRPFKAFYDQSPKLINIHRNLFKSRLIPSIEERLAEEEAAKKAGRPPKDYDDLLQWHMDIVRPEHRTAEALAEMQLNTMLVTIHSITLSLGSLLLELASHPEYIQPLREEIQAVIKEDGGVVQKSTLQNMRKLDSFMRETFRLGGITLCRYPFQSPP